MPFIGFFVSGNPNLALKYCSDVTGGHKCHLEVIIEGQLEVNHQKSSVLDLLVSFHRFLVMGNQNLALEYCSDVSGVHNCHLEVIIEGQLEVNH